MALPARGYKSCVSKSEPLKVHIADVSKTCNDVTYTSVYPRRTFREDGKVKHETLGNFSDLPSDLIELMRQRLAQNEPLSGIGEKMTIQRSQPRRNMNAVLMTLHNIGMDQLIASHVSTTSSHVKLFRVSSNTKSASLSLVPLTGCNCFLPCSRALRISSGPRIATRYGMSVP